MVFKVRNISCVLAIAGFCMLRVAVQRRHSGVGFALLDVFGEKRID